MPDEHTPTLRQIDLARADFAAIESHLDVLHQQLARLPTRRNLLDMTIVGVLWTTGVVLLGQWLLFH